MKMKLLVLLGAVTLSMTPFAAFADITIKNNTSSAATAFAGNSPCSSAAGDRGVMQPHAQVTIPDFLVGMYCSSDCKAQVFMSKNCSGKSIATIVANKREGIKSIANNDSSPNGYHLEGHGNTISIEGGPSRKWYQLFF
jgi:hypothetical protein